MCVVRVVNECFFVFCFCYLQLLVLKQAYYQTPDIIDCFLVTHEGEQVVKHHNLEVCQHRVASMPGATASNLQHKDKSSTDN